MIYNEYNSKRCHASGVTAYSSLALLLGFNTDFGVIYGQVDQITYGYSKPALLRDLLAFFGL
jgi:hypothetical protein